MKVIFLRTRKLNSLPANMKFHKSVSLKTEWKMNFVISRKITRKVSFPCQYIRDFVTISKLQRFFHSVFDVVLHRRWCCKTLTWNLMLFSCFTTHWVLQSNVSFCTCFSKIVIFEPKTSFEASLKSLLTKAKVYVTKPKIS